MTLVSLIFLAYCLIDLILVFINKNGDNLRYVPELIVDAVACVGCFVLGKLTGTAENADTPMLVAIVAAYFVIKLIIKRLAKRS